MFLFKKKKLVVNCFTNRQEVASYAPIKHAHAFYPEWWKSLPKTMPTHNGTIQSATMKTCAGMRDLYQQGLMLPMWCDLNMDVGEVGNVSFRYQYADEKSIVETHIAEQRGGFANENLYQHVKLLSPWRLTCDEEIPFMWVEPTWNMQDLTQYRVLPGVTEFKYQHATHINMMFPRKPQEVSTVLIPFGTPLVQMVPVTEREIDIRVIEDAQMFTRLIAGRLTFVNRYKTVKEIDKARCPR